MVLICLFLASERDCMVLLTLLELDGVGLGMGCRLGECKNTIHGKTYWPSFKVFIIPC